MSFAVGLWALYAASDSGRRSGLFPLIPNQNCQIVKNEPGTKAHQQISAEYFSIGEDKMRSKGGIK
jgi:hypothetical protein